MRLENGMYLRNYYGRIAKVEYIVDDIVYCDNWLYKSCSDTFDFIKLEEIEEEIEKTSFNVIDLLEKRDLVEIEYYSPRIEKRISRLFEVDYKDEKSMSFTNFHFQFLILDGNFSKKFEELKPVIKAVITRKQLDRELYKVGDK